MSESEAKQQTIFGEEIAQHIQIETTGRVIRPWKRMLDQITAEYRLRFDDEGIHVRTVDTANVIAIRTTLPADAFETYELDEDITLGVKASQLGTVLQHARYGKSSDDAISLTAESGHIESEVDREFGGCGVTLSERSELIDPGAIRESPDFPDLDLGVSAEMAPQTFIEVLEAMDNDSGEHMQLGARPDSVLLKQNTDIDKRAVEIDVTPSETAEYTWFSMYYVSKMQTALSVGYVDELTLRWDEEFPLFAEFEREDSYYGEIMLAPRIQSQ